MDVEAVTAVGRIFMYVSDIVPPQNMPEVSPLPFPVLSVMVSAWQDGQPGAQTHVQNLVIPREIVEEMIECLKQQA